MVQRLVHNEAFSFIKAQQPEMATSVVEIGSRFINGGVRGLFPSAAYLGLDIAPGPGVDLVADGRSWQPLRLVDTVVCAEVLEHCEQPEAIVRNAAEMLEKGGRLILTCATTGRPPHSGVDGGPVRYGEYYRNVTIEELQPTLEECFTFVSCVEDEVRGDLYLVAVR